MTILNLAVAIFTFSIFLAIIGLVSYATYGVWAAAGLSMIFMIRYLWHKFIKIVEEKSS